MDFILIWFGGLYAVFLAMMAVESATDEKPWAAFATGAAIGAAGFGILGGLMYLIDSWMSNHPWGWLLLLGFIVVAGCVWFVVGVTGLLVRLLYRD